MKAIILAAGEGTRMRPLTEDTPKPLVLLSGKSLLDHIVCALPEEVDELIVVVGYKGDQIERHVGKQYYGKKVCIIKQEKPTGTFDALLLAKPLIKKGESFFVLYADDLHGAQGIKECLKYQHSILVANVDDPTKFGVVEHDCNMKIMAIEEKPKEPKSKIVSTGVLLLTDAVFRYKPLPGPKGELYLTTAVADMLIDNKVYAVKASFWYPISTPDDIKNAEKVGATKYITKDYEKRQDNKIAARA